MIFHLGCYRLSPEERSLTRNGDSLELEPRVFDLLVYLVRNRDRVSSKDELLAAVWGEGFHASDDTLFKAIQRARKALGDNGRDQAWIKTFHGRGYRYVGRCAPENEPAQDDEPLEVVGRDAQPLPAPAPEKSRSRVLFLLASAALLLILGGAAATSRLSPAEAVQLETQAILAETEGDLDAAIGLRSALVALQPDQPETAFRLAMLLMRSGRLDEAGALLDQQRDATTSLDQRLQLALLQARMKERSDLLPAARERAQEATSLAVEMERSDLELRSRLLEAGLSMRLDDLDQAADQLGIAVPIAQTLGNSGLLAEAHLTEARLLIEQGDIEGFSTREQLARDLFEQVGDSLGLARLERERARVDYNTGDLETAANRLERALELLRGAADSFHEAIVITDLADVLTDLGRYGRAEELYDRASILLANQGGLRRRAALENSRGILYYRLAESRTAARHYDEALRLYLEAGNRGGAFATIYNLVAMSLENCGVDAATRYLDQAVEIQAELSESDRAAIHHLQGRVALERLQLDEAERLLSQARSERLALGEELDAAMTELLLSERAFESGDLASAEQWARAARARTRPGSSRFVWASIWLANLAYQANQPGQSTELVTAIKDQELALVLEIERDLVLARLARSEGRARDALELAKSALNRAEETRTHEIRLRSARLLENLRSDSRARTEIRQEAKRLGCVRIARSKLFEIKNS